MLDELCIKVVHKSKKKNPAGANFDSGKPSSTEALPNGTGERRDALPQCWLPVSPQTQHIALSTEMADKWGDSVECGFYRMASFSSPFIALFERLV
ncbi:hypothetical protein AB4P01_21155 [Escherichia coli]|jgi:hypothetical protein|uniref:hypothetical protein n=1 Tax=Escherichia coli TaxID=562 RepID=UPI000BDF92CD